MCTLHVHSHVPPRCRICATFFVDILDAGETRYYKCRYYAIHAECLWQLWGGTWIISIATYSTTTKNIKANISQSAIICTIQHAILTLTAGPGQHNDDNCILFNWHMKIYKQCCISKITVTISCNIKHFWISLPPRLTVAVTGWAFFRWNAVIYTLCCDMV